MAKRYRVQRYIGTGSIGSVYAVEHLLHPEKPLVAKVLFQELVEHPTAFSQFRTQFAHAFKLDDPYIVRVYEAFKDEIYTGYTSECGQVGNLHHAIPTLQKSPIQKRLDTIYKVALGVASIHHCGSVHRGLKPANIIFFQNGSLKISDCGLSYLPSATALISKKETELRPVLPYLGPEYILNVSLDRRSDIYALGVLAYEILTGKLPFESQNCSELLRMGPRERVIPIETFCRDVPEHVEAIIQKALCVDPLDRYQDIADLVGELAVIGAVPSHGNIVNTRHYEDIDLTLRAATAPPVTERENSRQIPSLDSTPLEFERQMYANSSGRNRRNRGGTVYWKNGLKDILGDVDL